MEKLIVLKKLFKKLERYIIVLHTLLLSSSKDSITSAHKNFLISTVHNTRKKPYYTEFRKKTQKYQT